MSEHTNTSAASRARATFCRGALCRAVAVLVLAATVAACDRCGDFVSPIGYWGGSQPDACRDQAPKIR